MFSSISSLHELYIYFIAFHNYINGMYSAMRWQLYQLCSEVIMNQRGIILITQSLECKQTLATVSTISNITKVEPREDEAEIEYYAYN